MNAPTGDTLADALHDSTDNLTLDRPLADVVARGDRLRRRRARRYAAGGVAAAAVAVSAASLALPSSTSPLVPAASAAWGSQLVNLSPDELEEAGETCRSMMSGEGGVGFQLPRDADPLAADTRDGVTMLFYRVGDHTADCTLAAGDGFQPASSSTGTWRELPTGSHVELISLTAATGTPTGPVRDAAGAVRVSDAVDRVEIEVAGLVQAATIASGVAMFWVPDGLSQAEVDALRVTAYDAAGKVLDSGELLE